MGRFSNLEFERHDPVASQASGFGQELRDDGYYLRLADQDYRTARFDRALRHYSRALEYNANLVAAWVGQVQMLVELEEYSEAKLWADKALEVHRDHPELLSAKAVAWARLGDAERAIGFSDAAVAQRGATAEVWLARGEALMAGRKSNDDHCLENAASEAKHDWFMQVRIARIFAFYGQFARAMAWVVKALRQEPAAPFAIHVQGECLLALGLLGRAADSYRQALSLDADFAPSRAALDRLEGRGMLLRMWDTLWGMVFRR